MDCTRLEPTNGARPSASWMEEISIALDPFTPASVGRGGFLRVVRMASGPLAVLLVASFTLHCTRSPMTAQRGRRLTPDSAIPSNTYEESGTASWYGGGDGFAGKATASGEIFDPSQLTAAHKTLPLGTWLEVEDINSHRKVIVKVNDRGPFIRGRILDLSKAAAERLGMLGTGTAEVRIRAVDVNDRPVALDPAEDLKNPYTIQVAALRDAQNIQRLREQLESDFGAVTLQDAITTGGVTVHRVRVGSYTSREEAEKAAQQITKRLKDRGVDPFITREH
ncbi:MAG TPA: septal ring lytic transglycosylase RlpA family protein [Holophagaceae bacterium]|jgi:rare lipoprotein A|nr:septal ring lytic transglycosylase RlpA family protein [Holophagaceae bacterium]